MLRGVKAHRPGIVALSLSVAVGVLVSPAFTLGTMAKTKVSAVIAGVAVIAWGAFRWHAKTWDLYTQSVSTAFGAMNARIEGVVITNAATEAVFLTASCFLAGAICRRAYHHERENRPSLAMGAAAAVMVFIAQAGLMQTSLTEAGARGVEGGRIRAVAAARESTEAVMSELGMDDREKLLVGYAERKAALRNLGTERPELDFRRYVKDMSKGCLGAETEIAICDNESLAEVRRTGKIGEYLTTRNAR